MLFFIYKGDDVENLKVKVGNKAESKEVQDLFGEFGLNMNVWSEFAFPKYISNFIDGEFSDYSIYDSGLDDWKEITIPELRDMVVLKRNSIEDATHENNHGQKLYKAQKGWYIYALGSWLWNEESLWYTPIPLKPVEKKEMKEYLVKDPQTGKYWETSDKNERGIVCEIPVGAVKAYLNNSKTINFINADDDYMNSVTDGKWVDTHRGKHDLCGHILVWKRETLNDQVASAKEFKQPEDLPFLDNGVDIGVENLPEFNQEFPSEKEIKTDFPLNRGDVNYRVAKAFNEIRGTDLTEDDLDFIRKLIDLTVSHYTDRF